LSTAEDANDGSQELPSFPIHVNLDWAEVLNLPVPDTNHTAIEALMAPISASYPRLPMTTSLLSELMADRLAVVNLDLPKEYETLNPEVLQRYGIESLESKDV